MQLRGYQIDIINQTRASMANGCKSNLIVLPTGGGKTLLTASMLKSAASKNKSSLFIVHRRELVEQSAAAFDLLGIDYGIISSGFDHKYNPFAMVQICSIQTLIRRIDQLRRIPDLIVWDECHHQGSKSWSNLFYNFDSSYHIGLTATPIRLDGKGLGVYFKKMIQGPTVSELIRDGFLSDYKYFAAHSIDLSNVHTQMGDYKKSELSSLVTENKFIGDAVSEYIKHSNGKRAVVFCVNIDHATIMKRKFLDAGIPSAHLDGETDALIRRKTLDQFKRGEIKVLTNVDLFGEGFDLPSIECVILLRPTQSLSLFMQQCGRALRPSPGKSHAIIIDHVGNLTRHGLPDDDREWSLDVKTKSQQEPSIKICQKCFAANKPNATTCSNCGEFLLGKKKERDPKYLDQADGDLSEVDKSKFKKKSIDLDRARAVTRDQLMALAIARGYKRPHFWVKHILNARQAKKNRGKKDV